VTGWTGEGGWSDGAGERREENMLVQDNTGIIVIRHTVILNNYEDLVLTWGDTRVSRISWRWSEGMKAKLSSSIMLYFVVDVSKIYIYIYIYFNTVIYCTNIG